MKHTFPMDADILPPSDDRIFKVLLTHPNAKEVLIDVISAVIEKPVLDVQIRNNELPAMYVDEKSERLDVNCTIDNGDQVNVEMQCSEMKEIGFSFTNFINRYVYFMSDLHSSQKSKGMDYKDLVRTYQATFCMYNVLPDWPDFVNRFTLRSANGKQLSDQLNMVIIELGKIDAILKKPVKELSSFEKWLLFFRFAQDPVHREKINGIIEDKEEINMAATLLREISQDERERAHAHSRKKYEMDMYSYKKTSELIGEMRERDKWQGVVADKDAEIERLRLEISELKTKK